MQMVCLRSATNGPVFYESAEHAAQRCSFTCAWGCTSGSGVVAASSDRGRHRYVWFFPSHDRSDTSSLLAVRLLTPWWHA